MDRFSTLTLAKDLPKIVSLIEASRRPPAQEGTPERTWYSIANVSQAETEILIYEEIGMFGVTASDFANDLRAVKAKTITLLINSTGGDVFEALGIYNAIRRHPADVNVFVDGIAASAASFLAMAGDTITMSPHSQMMIHDASGFAMGNAADMRELADLLDFQSNNIAAIYAERAGGTVAEWRERMLGETWLTDQETVDLGLADSIEGAEDDEVVEDVVVAPQMTLKFPDLTAVIEPEPEPEPATDFKKLFDDITQSNEDKLYAGVA